MINNIQKNQLISNWQQVTQHIDHAIDKSNRDSNSVQLIAVSKTKPVAMVTTLASMGQVHFAENYLQEALEKIAYCRDFFANKQPTSTKDSDNSSIVWHYIGHIQRNKTRDIANNFDWVHTVDRFIIAKRLNEQRPAEHAKLNVLLQVNIDNEESKSGCAPHELSDLVTAVSQLDKLALRGIMVIPAKSNTDSLARTQDLFKQIKEDFPELNTWDNISMGMSADLEEAVTQGSTMVRIGSAIFGARD